MPNLSQDELQTLVDDADLGAVTLDTNVFHRFGYNLEANALVELAQFPQHGIRHLVTDVVAGEVRAHMIERDEEAITGLRGAMRAYSKQRRRFGEATAAVAGELGLDDDVETVVYRQWLDFIATTGAELVDASQVDGATLVEMYFAPTSPFETGEEKKSEFPDAIALLALEAQGRAMGKHVLAVTRDAGWARFAETAGWVVTIGDVLAAINLLHKADAVAAERAVALLANPVSGIRDDVDAALSRFVDDLDPSIEAESFMEVSADLAGASIAGVHPVDPTSATVLASDAETVTLAFEVTVEVDVEADFSFQVHDSVDDDYMGVGSTSATRRIVLAAPVTLVVLRGSTEEDGAVSVNVDQPHTPTVEFGFLEPDGWGS